MNHIYGHKFSATYGESATNQDGNLTDVAQTWSSGLRGVTGEEFANGLRACVASGNEWPPSLPEFRAMCRAVSDPIHRQYVSLPRPAVDPEVIRENISKMKEMLKGDSHDKPESKAVASPAEAQTH